MLSYRIPREPSTPRIAVWRRLKRLGVVALGDGLVALPYDSSTKESLEWVANAVWEADGDATIWIATPSIQRWRRELANRMAEERAAEYRVLTEEALLLVAAGQPANRATKKLKAELRRIERRDHFPPQERLDARAALARLEDHASEQVPT